MTEPNDAALTDPEPRTRRREDVTEPLPAQPQDGAGRTTATPRSQPRVEGPRRRARRERAERRAAQARATAIEEARREAKRQAAGAPPTSPNPLREAWFGA